jgi:hypothetical protein
MMRQNQVRMISPFAAIHRRGLLAFAKFGVSHQCIAQKVGVRIEQRADGDMGFPQDTRNT